MYLTERVLLGSKVPRACLHIQKHEVRIGIFLYFGSLRLNFIPVRLTNFVLDIMRIYSFFPWPAPLLLWEQKWTKTKHSRLTYFKSTQLPTKILLPTQYKAIYQLSQGDLEYCNHTPRVHSQSTHRRADRVCDWESAHCSHVGTCWPAQVWHPVRLPQHAAVTVQFSYA